MINGSLRGKKLRSTLGQHTRDIRKTYTIAKGLIHWLGIPRISKGVSYYYTTSAIFKVLFTINQPSRFHVGLPRRHFPRPPLDVIGHENRWYRWHSESSLLIDAYKDVTATVCNTQKTCLFFFLLPALDRSAWELLARLFERLPKIDASTYPSYARVLLAADFPRVFSFRYCFVLTFSPPWTSFPSRRSFHTSKSRCRELSCGIPITVGLEKKIGGQTFESQFKSWFGLQLMVTNSHSMQANV